MAKQAEKTKPMPKEKDPLEILMRETAAEAKRRGWTQADIDRMCEEARARVYDEWKRKGKI